MTGLALHFLLKQRSLRSLWESGPGARPILQEWVVEIRDHCVAARVPFFFKQWGGVEKKRAGRALEGCTWDEMPANPSLGKQPS